MLYLFIGGCADGKRIALPHLVSVYYVPCNANRHGSQVCVTDRATYRSMEFAGSDGEQFTVFALDGMSGSDVLRSLISNYASALHEEAAA